MGDTSETNTKVLSRELVLGVVALKRLYRKIIICATRILFSGTVTYAFSVDKIMNYWNRMHGPAVLALIFELKNSK